ncbi:MAG: hypothetical protein Tsb0033_21230 [Winogradskyella sp.]
MYASKVTKKTSILVLALINMKREELILCDQKAIVLSKQLNYIDNNEANRCKIRMAKQRRAQLQKTIKNLIQLEEKIENLKFFQENDKLSCYINKQTNK